MIAVRSSSRVGVTDFGVNAIRLNYIAAALVTQGWKINEITAKDFPDYFGESVRAESRLRKSSTSRPEISRTRWPSNVHPSAGLKVATIWGSSMSLL